MMLIRDLISLSFRNLLLHKMRSLLTSLGVIFGVIFIGILCAVHRHERQEFIKIPT